MQDVLKREVVEEEKAQEAKNQIKRAANRALRAKITRESKQDKSQPDTTLTNSQIEEGGTTAIQNEG
jgi:hypothetical protein